MLLSASSNATSLLDSFNTTALEGVGEPIPIDFEVRLLPVSPAGVTQQAFLDLMMQALCLFAMSDNGGQTYPLTFHNSKYGYNDYALTVYGLSPSSPRTMSTIKNRPALWGSLRVLERISGLEQWTAVKAEFYMHGSILGEIHFDFRKNFPVLGIDTDPVVGGDNMDVGSGTSPLVLASDPSISTGSSSSSSSKELAYNSPTASNATLWPSSANLTSSSSSVANKYGRVELIPHYGRFPLNPYQIMVSYARALAIGGLAIPPKTDRPPPSIRFDQQDLKTSVFFDRAAPMAALSVWTYEWIITAISRVADETWAPPYWGLLSCVYDVKVDGILLGYAGIGPLR